MDLQAPVLFAVPLEESELSEFVHQDVDLGLRGANHLGQQIP